jgi:hypothetical protein
MIATLGLICDHKVQDIQYWGIIQYLQIKLCTWSGVSVSGTCRIPKRLLYTVRESTGFMGCIPAGRSWMGSRSNQPQVKSAPGQISPKSNRPHGGPCYIYIKLNGNTDIWLCSFPLMLRACWRSKNTNFYSLWFDIIISYRKMIFCLFLVAKARVPSGILSSWSVVLSCQIDVPYVYKPLAMMNFRECFKVNF